jgi:hypothetical protein
LIAPVESFPDGPPFRILDEVIIAAKVAMPRLNGTNKRNREKRMRLPMPQLDLLSEERGGVDDEVRTQVWGLLTALYPRNDLVERRRDNRYPFPCLIHLTPVGSDGHTPCGATVVVVGKHLSTHGFGFYHQAPLPHRRMIASLEAKRGQWFAFLIDLNWCRFTKGGWYESGGRLLQTVLSPMDEPVPS